jgi:hypothetical protein
MTLAKTQRRKEEQNKSGFRAQKLGISILTFASLRLCESYF